jgi:thioredoxin reductase
MSSARGGVEVAIVGAGPYGLSLSAHLRDRGIEHRILGSPMESWRDRMPAGMLLRSEGFASNLSDPTGQLTLANFAAESGRDVGRYGTPVPLEAFCDYVSWFTTRAGVDVEDTLVERLSERSGAFTLELASGESLRASRVVLAVGTTHFAYIPPVLRAGGDQVMHASKHSRLEGFRGKDVTVIGAGQSATEIAALLAEAGAQPRLVARRRTTWLAPPPPLERPLVRRVKEPIAGLSPGWESWAFEHLAWGYRFLPEQQRVYLAKKKHGPGGAWWLRDRVEGRIPVLTGRTLREAAPRPCGVRLTLRGPDDTEEVVDTEHVIAATGYRVDLQALQFLDPAIRGRLRTLGGAPMLSAGLQSSVPGLHFLGMSAATSFGPVMRFVVGTEFASPTLTKHLARHRARGTH